MSTKVPQTRLNQVAQRKLSEWEVPTELVGDRLEGVLCVPPDSPLFHPLTGERIERLLFYVVGHDRLVLTDPPVVRDFPPQPYYDHQHVDSVLRQIQIRLNRRASAVHQLVKQLGNLGLPCQIDEGRAKAVADVDLPGLGVAVLVGDENSLHIEYLVPEGGQGPIPVSLQVDLREFVNKSDLELFLVTKLGRNEPAEESPPLELEEEVAEAPPEPQTSEAVTLGRLCAALGEGVTVSPGLILQQDLQVGETPVRFAARFEGGQTFSSKVVVPEGAIWAGQFSLADFPGIADFVAGLLGEASIAEPAPPMTEQFTTNPILTSGYQHPVAGEVWVMNVLVESDDGREIRYVGVDIDGQPFGAPRVLARENFLQVFMELQQGCYALRVEILRTSDDQVEYVQLDSKSKRLGEPRSARLNPFLCNFTPEAAAY